jgi:hypothetical protein
MAIALRRAMAVVYAGALFLSRASTDPGRETFLRLEKSLRLCLAGLKIR